MNPNTNPPASHNWAPDNPPTFRITARINFLTDIKESLNFNEDYADSLEKQELFTMEE